MQDCFLDTTENGVLKLKCRLKSVVEDRITGVASQQQETQLDIKFRNCYIGAKLRLRYERARVSILPSIGKLLRISKGVLI